MTTTLYVRPYIISAGAAGLCNQLSFFINSILYCNKNNIEKLIISDFVSDLTNKSKIAASEILNIVKTNEYLKKFNVEIIDSIKDNTNYDFSEENNKLSNYSSLSEDWINFTNFFDIFKNLVFSESYYRISNNLIPEIKNKLGENIKINVIHLRIENDSINHWSSINKMNPFQFKDLLEKKYINLIKHFINKNVFTIVMTYSANNEVIRFMANNKYNFFINRKDINQGRECNALTDLLLAQKMNNFFIGVIGSTFSNFILNTTNKRRSIMININEIKKPPLIIDY